MKPTTKLRNFVLIFLIGLTSLACALGKSTATPTSVPAIPTPNPTAAPSVKLGAEMRFDDQGFAFKPLPEYKLDTNFGVQMLAPGADPELGPAFILAGGESTSGTTVQSLLDDLKSDEVEVSPAIPLEVDGKKGLSAEMKRSTGDLVGKVVVVMVTPVQQFTMFAVAPQAEWEGEIVQLFEAVLASVKLFEMKAPEAGANLPEATPTKETLQPTHPAPTTELQEIRQWAVSAKASSQYGNSDWAASQATGAPDTTTCGDHGTAWAAAQSNTEEWIELTFATPVEAVLVNVYITYNPAYITKMELLDTQGKYHSIYGFEAQSYPECPYIFSVDVTETGFQAVALKISLDQQKAPSWVEIDAVELVGLGAAG